MNQKWKPKPQGAIEDNWKTIFAGAGQLAIGQPYYSANLQYRLIMQSDGNLVLYDSANNAVWHSVTYGNPGSNCFLQSDGNFVIYNQNGQPIWHTYTNGNDGASLQISNDGKIRIRKNNQTLWQS